MPQIRTSRYYTKLPDLDVSKFSGKVIVGFSNNPALADPPELPACLQTKKTAFDETIVAAAGRGPLQTALKDAARVVLIPALNKDASYVDINCDDDLTILLSSGFEAVSTNRTQQMLEAPVGEFGPVITFRRTREIVFEGLIAGTTYICGLGGSPVRAIGVSRSSRWRSSDYFPTAGANDFALAAGKEEKRKQGR